jgi:hypothetical protein
LVFSTKNKIKVEYCSYYYVYSSIRVPPVKRFCN